MDKKFYTQWWFWVIIGVVFLGVLGSVIPNDNISDDKDSVKINTYEEPIVIKSWHRVTSFKGVSDKTTDTFYISGNKFRLTYEVNPENEYSYWSVFIYEEKYNSYVGFYTLEEGKALIILFNKDDLNPILSRSRSTIL